MMLFVIANFSTQSAESSHRMGGDRRSDAKMLHQVCKACTASGYVEKYSFPILMPKVYLTNALSYVSRKTDTDPN